ncbi:MAG: NAD-dependent epimerase/dehydratase family protein [Phycisphaerales bacterium]|nr:NAD-dependent epimerase/dehydratase family protein [Phycisphaerales bacterium]
MRDLSAVRIAVTGAGGFLGRHVVEALAARGCRDVLTPSRGACDLLDRSASLGWMQSHKPDMVVHCAAATGGVGWNNTHAYEAFRDNLLMTLHLVDACIDCGVQHVTHISTSIAYPPTAAVPFEETSLWKERPGGPTAGYAHAKRLGQAVLEHAQSQHGLQSAVVMPANMYGAGARMDPSRSNVVAAMVKRFVDAADTGASEVVCWGSGRPMREFIDVRDVADGVVRAAERVDTPEPINLGTGQMCSIRELAERVASCVGWQGEIQWDTSKPDGVDKVCCDVNRMQQALEWLPCIELEDGLRRMVTWYLEDVRKGA